MKIYFIHTFATEDQPDMIVGYDYSQYQEMIAILKANNRPYTTWTQDTE